MATYQLTPKTAQTLTGLTPTVLGWQLTLETAMDVLTGCNRIYAAAWVPQLSILTESALNSPTWQLQLTKGNQQVSIHDTDWIAFDGLNVWSLTQADVAENYTVTPYELPALA